MDVLNNVDAAPEKAAHRLHLIASDGLTLAVEEFGSGPPVLYGHGLTGSRSQTALQLAPLAANCRVIVYDQRGHGDSTPVTDPAGYDVERMAADVTAVLDALQIDRAVVGGNSMGAATALRFAMEHPGRVEALILTANAFTYRPNPAVEQLRQIGRDVARLGIEGYLASVTSSEWPAAGMSDEAIAFRARMWRKHDAASIAAACQAVAGWIPVPDLNALCALQFPALVIAWDGDSVHPLEFGQSIAGALPRARLELCDVATYYNDPPAVGRVCAEFLENIRREEAM